MMKIKLITAPTFEPIGVEEAMLAARIDENSGYEENLIAKYLTAAVNHVEDITSRKLCTQTWDYYLDAFPCGDSIKIPFGNLASVTHIKYTDSDGSETTMTVTTEYLVETNGEGCGMIVLPYGVSWPSFTAYTSHPIVIRFVCGWTIPALVPNKIKAAILLVLADLYQNRESQVLSSFDYKNNKTLMALLRSYTLWDEF
jgi:uncharacterized phiE125 gp8 family phage protein